MFIPLVTFGAGFGSFFSFAAAALGLPLVALGRPFGFFGPAHNNWLLIIPDFEIEQSNSESKISITSMKVPLLPYHSLHH